MADNPAQINKALSLTDELIDCLNTAERQLSSARNWGFLDVLGGGLVVDLIKHSKLRNAQTSMEHVNNLMQELKNTLGSISITDDYRMQIGGFATFADFFFDSAFVDVYMTAKIMNSLSEVRRLKEKCYELKRHLSEI